MQTHTQAYFRGQKQFQRNQVRTCFKYEIQNANTNTKMCFKCKYKKYSNTLKYFYTVILATQVYTIIQHVCYNANILKEK